MTANTYCVCNIFQSLCGDEHFMCIFYFLLRKILCSTCQHYTHFTDEFCPNSQSWQEANPGFQSSICHAPNHGSWEVSASTGASYSAVLCCALLGDLFIIRTQLHEGQDLSTSTLTKTSLLGNSNKGLWRNCGWCLGPQLVVCHPNTFGHSVVAVDLGSCPRLCMRPWTKKSVFAILNTLSTFKNSAEAATEVQKGIFTGLWHFAEDIPYCSLCFKFRPALETSSIVLHVKLKATLELLAEKHWEGNETP